MTGDGKLRRFALAVYAEADVAPACLTLQERFGVDVNVVLFAAYVGAVGRRRLDDAELDGAHAAIGEWHDEVVRPLRSVRRRLKSGPSPAPNPATAELRRRIQKAEIDAELVELDELDALTGPAVPTTDSDPTDLAAGNVGLVVARASTGPLAQDERDAAEVIAAAAARHAERG